MLIYIHISSIPLNINLKKKNKLKLKLIMQFCFDLWDFNKHIRNYYFLQFENKKFSSISKRRLIICFNFNV